MKKQNIRSIKNIRDVVEHSFISSVGSEWYGLFQATALNYNNFIKENIGNNAGIDEESNLAIQLAKLSQGQVAGTLSQDVPEEIKSLNTELASVDSEIKSNTEYSFSVYFTMTSTSKSKSNLVYVSTNDEAGADAKVVIKNKVADDLYPHRPMAVCKAVAAAIGKPFSSNMHAQSYLHYKIRPRKQPDEKESNVNKKYTIYHKAHGDYTYSDEWVSFLSEEMKDDVKYEAVRKLKL